MTEFWLKNIVGWSLIWKGFWDSTNKSFHFGGNFAYSFVVNLSFCDRNWRYNKFSRKSA